MCSSDLDVSWGTFAVNSLDGNATHYQGGDPVLISPGVQLFDADMAALGDGGNYAGMSVTIQRDGGAVADDIIAMNPFLDAIFYVDAGVLRDSAGYAFGSIASGTGSLTVTFDSLETPATQLLVDAVLSNLVYSTAAALPPTSVTLEIGRAHV